MRDIVVNRCYGGFSVSLEAVQRLRALGYPPAIDETLVGEKWPDSDEVRKAYLSSYYLRGAKRDDPDLVRVVRDLGPAANGECARLEVVSIPEDVAWEIDEYDGMESIHEVHRSW